MTRSLSRHRPRVGPMLPTALRGSLSPARAEKDLAPRSMLGDTRMCGVVIVTGRAPTPT
jgi:hypothetical protein